MSETVVPRTRPRISALDDAGDIAEKIRQASRDRQCRILGVKRSVALERYTLPGGQVINGHTENSCWGYWCPIHNPSPHHMVKWTQYFDDISGKMFRECPQHTVSHPDPDEPVTDYGAHERSGCCGCCDRRAYVKRGNTK